MATYFYAPLVVPVQALGGDPAVPKRDFAFLDRRGAQGLVVRFHNPIQLVTLVPPLPFAFTLDDKTQRLVFFGCKVSPIIVLNTSGRRREAKD